MTWEYADLSKAAKNAGGPEKFVDQLINAGKNAGHKEMLPLTFAALGVGILGYACIQKLIQCLNKKSVSPEELESAKKEIIDRINEYDSTHSEQTIVNDEKNDDENKENKEKLS
ncbi:hypothetical protein ACLD5S_06105 [Gardnerella vaginalis]|uniref:hypothetical protein n=1 Tax=Gardnerella vaginalis TaxID=2702 RepID=UPI0039710A95